MKVAVIAKTPLHIAIDGPVASGKSTVAARLAQRLGCPFLDTGALYRAVALGALRRGLQPDDPVVADVADAVSVEPGEGLHPWQARIRLNGTVVGEEAFSPDVSRAVSAIAALPEVRRRLLPVQRRFADGRDVVMAGRDIGTVVLPDARHKFFLTASLPARAERRWRELRAQGAAVTREAVEAEIAARDRRDATRAVSPLRAAPDALTLDTSEMTVDDVVETLLRHIRGSRRI
jgi:cytidylate kinase